MTRHAALGRPVASVLLGLAAVVCAVLAAVGPANEERATYSWPPPALPASAPTRAWLGPLLLARRQPARFDATIPCGAHGTVDEAGDPVLVLSTTRDVLLWNGLAVTRSPVEHVTVVRAGYQELGRIEDAGPQCSFEVRFTGRSWVIDRDGKTVASGTIDNPLGVNGLLTQLDLHERPGLHVSVEPIAQDTSPSASQVVLQIVAALLVVTGILVTLEPRGRRRERRQLPRPAAQDAFVAVVLVAYWVLAPLQDDDGWVRARQANSLVSGGFSSYFQHGGVNLPFITWFEWVQHFAVAHSGSILLNRLPTVAILAATWLVCRHCLSQLVGRGPGARDGAWWAAAAVFSLGAAAFGITLRPEPPIALLAAAVLACCLRYIAAPSLPPLLGAVLLSGSAIAIHPSGVIALAPLLGTVPRIVATLRQRLLPAAGVLGVVLVGLGWMLLLLFLDSDLAHRQDSITTIQEGDASESQGPWRELDRYRRVLQLGSTPLRREFVAILLLTVAVALLGRLWRRSLAEKLPTLSIAIALVVLVFTPSKWIWHFGTLVGLCAIAAGVELNRLAQSRRSSVIGWLAAGVLLLSALWAARGSFQWTTYETGSPPGWNDVPYAWVVVGAGVLAIALAIWVLRGRMATAMLVAVVVALLGTTGVALAYDATRTTWTVARQTLSELGGRGSCGMADGLIVPAPSSVRPLNAVAQGPAPGGAANGSGDRTGTWFTLPAAPIGVLVAPPTSGEEAFVVTWGRTDGDRVRTLSAGTIDPAAATAGYVWTHRVLIGEGSFPVRPPEADVVKVERRAAGSAPPDATAELVSFDPITLESLLRRPAFHTLVTPYLFEAVPCATLPPLAYGVAGVPELVLEGDLWPAATGNSSPWAGLGDIFDVTRVPLDRWDTDRGLLYAYWIDGNPGETVVEPTRQVES